MPIAASSDENDEKLRALAAAALARGLEFLVKAQSKDGGWHSQTYGQFKGGAALTTFVLDVISHAEDWRKKHSDAVARGFEFLKAGFARRGTIACPDGSLDYPTYGGALWLLARQRLALAGEGTMRGDLLTYLLSAQCDEERGFDKESPSYGGWDFLGQGDAHGVTTGTNVSVTCLVAEALAGELHHEAGGNRKGEIQAALGRALEWANRCRRPDGGYCFTPEPASLNNKAEFRDEARHEPRAYGTATCDALRILLACVIKPDDQRIVKGMAWLAQRTSLELVPGFEDLPPERGWQRGLRFYYFASLAKILEFLPAADLPSRRRSLLELLLKLQSKDGHWVNESDRMRENDPLIATGLATVALAELLREPR